LERRFIGEEVYWRGGLLERRGGLLERRFIGEGGRFIGEGGFIDKAKKLSV
jgi:hypothetical protein